MDFQYENEIPTGTTFQVTDGHLTSYEVDGTLILSDTTLTNSEIGNSGDSENGPPLPPTGPFSPPTGTLVVRDGSTATGIIAQAGSSLTVDSGGTLSNLGIGTAFGSDDPIQYTGVHVDVVAGGTLDTGSVLGGFVNVDGTAYDLTMYGGDLTIGGDVEGVMAQGNQAMDIGGFSATTIVENGGLLDDGTFDGFGTLTLQAGATARYVVASGQFDPFEFSSNGGQMVTAEAGSTLQSLLGLGASISTVDGTATMVSADDSAAVYVGGTVSESIVTSASDHITGLFGLGEIVQPGFSDSEEALPSNAFSGLAVTSGGVVTGLQDSGLVAVENGGRLTDSDVTGGILAVYRGGVADNVSVGQGGAAYLSGLMTYDGAGTYVDAGNITSTVVNGTDPTTGASAQLEFVGGSILQTGTGTVVLEGNNQFYGTIVIASGTVELASQGATNDDGIQFQQGSGGDLGYEQPFSGGILQVLKLDPANAAIASTGVQVFGTPVFGEGLGSVFDLTGVRYDYLDRAQVGPGGLELTTANGTLKAEIETGGTGSTMQFLAVPDQVGTGTDILAIPDAFIVDAAKEAIAAFGAKPFDKLVRDVVDYLAAPSTSVTAVLQNFAIDATPNTAFGQFADNLQSEIRADPKAAIAIFKEALSTPSAQIALTHV